jgi:hypothetical protein
VHQATIVEGPRCTRTSAVDIRDGVEAGVEAAEAVVESKFENAMRARFQAADAALLADAASFSGAFPSCAAPRGPNRSSLPRTYGQRAMPSSRHNFFRDVWEISRARAAMGSGSMKYKLSFLYVNSSGLSELFLCLRFSEVSSPAFRRERSRTTRAFSSVSALFASLSLPLFCRQAGIRELPFMIS